MLEGPELMVRTLRRVRRRLVAARAVESGLRWALYGSALACAAIVLGALCFSFLPEWYVHPWGPLVLPPVGFVVGVVVRLARPTALRDAAIYLDRRAGLQERISTAYELARAGDTSPLAELVRRQADQACRRFHPGLIRYSRRLQRDARYLAAALMACGALLLLPPLKTQGYLQRQLNLARRQEAARLLQPVLPRAQQPGAEADARLTELMNETRRLAEALRRSPSADAQGDLAALAALAGKLAREQALRLAERELAESLQQARQVTALADALNPAAREARKSFASRAATGRLSPQETEAIGRLSQAAQQAGERSGDAALSESAGRMADALKSARGDAESLATDLERIAAAGRAAADRTAASLAARADDQLAAAVEALARATAAVTAPGEAPAVAGGANTEVRPPVAPPVAVEPKPVPPGADYAGIYAQRPGASGAAAPPPIGPGPRGPDEQAAGQFGSGLSGSAEAALKAADESPLPADLRNLVRRYFATDGR